MMRACDNCLENNWSYSYEESWVTAVCNLCGHEVTWETVKKLPIEQDGDNCRCGKGRVKLLEAKITEKKRNKAYYYTHSLKCLSCGKVYLPEKFKVVNEKVCKENIEWSLSQ